MNPRLTQMNAQEHASDLIREASRQRQAREGGLVAPARRLLGRRRSGRSMRVATA